MTTADVDKLAAKMMREHHAKNRSFLNYRGYPATVCTSINEEIVHTIPGSRRLKEGDLLSLDMSGCLSKAIAATSATTFCHRWKTLHRKQESN